MKATPTPGFVHESWDVQDGLPVIGINRMIQGSDGYLWMATFDGLVRFDGVRFTVFNTGNSPGLPSNRIRYVLESRDESLWLLTEQGHAVRFKNGVFDAMETGIGTGVIATAFCEDADGMIWIGSEDGVYAFRENRFVRFEPELIQGRLRQIMRSREGVLWMVPMHGPPVTWYRDGEVHSLEPYPGRSDPGGAVYEDAQGRVWLGALYQVSRFENGELTSIPVEGKQPGDRISVYEFYSSYGSGEVWMSTEESVYLYRGDRFERVAPSDGYTDARFSITQDESGNIWFLSQNTVYMNGEPVFTLPSQESPLTYITTMLQDHEGSFWVSSVYDGLHRLKPSVFTVYSEAEGLPGKNIYPVLEGRDGSVWLATWNSRICRIQDGRASVWGTVTLPLTLCEDSYGRLWVGALYGAKAWTVDEQARELTSAEHHIPGIMRAIYEDAHRVVWFGSERGLFQARGDSISETLDDAGRSILNVRAFYETREGSLWMGLNGGGLRRHRNGSIRSFTETQGLSSNLIRSLYEDDNGVLWVGTEGRGLCRLENHEAEDLRNIEVTVYRQANGLYDEVIHQILEDDFGRVWMNTNRGIFWVPLADLNAFARGEVERIQSTSYTERDGMRNREGNGGMQPAGMKAQDGKLWFPTQDGVVVVDPNRIQQNRVPPPVAIEVFHSGDTVFPLTGKRIHLSAEQRDLEIEYTALSFAAPENVRFKYRLEGYNEDWVDAGGRRTAFYTNVPPGDYTFQVMAANNDGVWNEDGASLALTIAPYFHETTLFRWILALLALGLVWSVYSWRAMRTAARERELRVLVEERTRELELAAEKLKSLDEAKSSFFANVSHEFRTPLTLIIGPLEESLKTLRGSEPRGVREDTELALRNAHRLLSLVNQILDIAKLEAGHMRLRAEPTDLAVFLKDISMPFISLAERKGIDFDLNLSSQPAWVYCDHDLMEKVFANLLSNAFKFTPQGGTVALELAFGGSDPDHIEVCVRDTGMGIPPHLLPHVFERFYQVEGASPYSEPGTGIGLALVRDILKLHQGTITAESHEGAGATFRVTLKAGRSHLRAEDVGGPSTGPAEAEDRGAAVELAGFALAANGAGASAESPQGNHPSDEDRTTVLVVEDNAEIREYIRKHFEPEYRLREAENGAQGLELATRTLPDLVISDIMMPDMDGYALCEALKTQPETDYIPVILLTAKAASGERLEGLKLGADDYLTKPFDVNELRVRVANLITSRQRLRERFGGNHTRAGSTGETGPAPVPPSMDHVFLERLREIVEGEMGDESFNVQRLADRLGMSRGHLHRKVRELLNETPTDSIRRVRLDRARELLSARAGTVSEVAYGVGFKSVSHFSKCFRDHTGTTPSEFVSRAAKDNP